MRANSQAVHANLQRVYAALKTVEKESSHWDLRSEVSCNTKEHRHAACNTKEQ